MAVAQNAGLWLREALKSILNSETNPSMKKILTDILQQINEWVGFGDSLYTHPDFFATDEIQLIKSAETMGNMPQVLREIATELENMQKIYAKIKSALSYPIALIGFTILAVAILLIKVIPTIVSLFPDPDKLPWITVFMISASDFLIDTRYVLILGVVWFIVWIKALYSWFLPFKKIIDKGLIHIPIISGVVKTFYMYRFSKLMGDFNHAGVGPVEATEQLADIFENYYYKRKAVEMKRDLEAWFSFADSIEWSPLFDPILVQIIIVGENTWNIGDVLITMSQFYRDAMRNKIDALMGVIEPILMGMIASVIGVVVWSIFLPLADLVNVIG